MDIFITVMNWEEGLLIWSHQPGLLMEKSMWSNYRGRERQEKNREAEGREKQEQRLRQGGAERQSDRDRETGRMRDRGRERERQRA